MNVVLQTDLSSEVTDWMIDENARALLTYPRVAKL